MLQIGLQGAIMRHEKPTACFNIDIVLYRCEWNTLLTAHKVSKAESMSADFNSLLMTPLCMLDGKISFDRSRCRLPIFNEQEGIDQSIV